MTSVLGYQLGIIIGLLDYAAQKRRTKMWSSLRLIPTRSALRKGAVFLLRGIMRAESCLVYSVHTLTPLVWARSDDL